MYSLLVLTDHAGHSDQNSLYALGRALVAHPLCASVIVASRSTPANRPFFSAENAPNLYGKKIDSGFSFEEQNPAFLEGLSELTVSDFDAIILRLPPPVPVGFFRKLVKLIPSRRIINRPEGILETSSKQFLQHFQDLCPPMEICRSTGDIRRFAVRFPIVLKPLNEYGGKGIVRLDNESAWKGDEKVAAEEYLAGLAPDDFPLLATKFLKNVSKGDKRVIVVNGELLGASLRLPGEGSWLCNVAMGGSSVHAEPDGDEREIADRLIPVLLAKGIVVFGFDTLVNDEGKRVLSEINTMSIGGFPQMEMQTGRPVVRQAADLLLRYIDQYMYGNVSPFSE